MNKPKSLRARLTLTTAMAGAMAGAILAAYGGRDANAGVCTPDSPSPNFVCTGPATATDETESLQNNGPVTVITATGFGIDTSVTGGDALTIAAKDGLTFNDTNSDGSIITGGTDGIDAFNEDSGALTITANGPVTGGAGGIGINVFNSVETDGLTISAAAVSGGVTGIDAINLGTGDLTITTSGTVTAVSNDGIAALNADGGALNIKAGETVAGGTNGNGIDAINLDTDTTSLTISAAGVSGGTTGIFADNFGTGDLTITTSGAVTGASNDGIVADNSNGGALRITAGDTVSAAPLGGDGIVAFNDVGTSSLTISAAGVSGGSEGIDAENRGTGDLTITTSGAVTGALNDGIDATNENGGALSITAEATVSGGMEGDGIEAANATETTTSLTISAAGVSGGYHGIIARNDGSGDLEVTATGAVTAGTGEGIEARNYTGGSLSITALGTVSSASSDGIFAKNNANTDSLTISAMGVSGSTNGISATNQGAGLLSITADGTVTAGTGDGINAFSQNLNAPGIMISTTEVDGARYGITASANAGDITIMAGDTVRGRDASGIAAFLPVRESTGDITISAAAVDGERFGIFALNRSAGSISVTASGAVTGRQEDGIKVNAGSPNATQVTISAAAVRGRNSGIVATNDGTGNLVITASGAVTGTSGYGIKASNEAGGAVSITAEQTVTGGGDGISAENDADGTSLTIMAAAAVSGDEDGIEAKNEGSGDLSITASGPVSGGNEEGIDARNYNGGSLTIDAMDTVTSDDADGIFAKNGAGTDRLTISAAGVGGGDHGIFAKNYGSGDLDVTATGAVTGGAGEGIEARNYTGGSLSITAQGTVSSTSADGIYAKNNANTDSLTIAAMGVRGGANGIDTFNLGTGDLTITTTGAVTAASRDGIEAFNANGGALRITADETVTGGPSGDGIDALNTFEGSSLTISAAGVVGGRDGIDADNSGTGDLIVTASGAVTGTSSNGIAASNGNGGALSITADETVTGGANGDGIDAFNSTDNTTSLTISAAGVSGGLGGIVADNRGTGDLDVTATGAVTGGAGEGIEARNYTGGSLSITAQGTVSSTSSDGIYAKNNANTDSLTISAMGVSGGNSGILATNDGTGDLVITASGAVTGDALYGIKAVSSAASGNLTISAAAVSGGFTGIEADNFGNGTLSISADGPVTGQTGYGISTYTNYNGTGMTIAAADVSGGQGGINAQNNGIGVMSIATTGTVLGTNTDSAGIEVYNSSNGGNLTITTAGVGGGTDGMYVRNFGSGALSIAASGTVTGTLGDGIFATHGTYGTGFTLSVVDVSGGTDGIDVHSTGSGPLVIEAASVTGGERGIAARSEGAGGLAVTTTGLVSGGTGDGMEVRNLTGGDLSIAASQTVMSAEAAGIQAFNEAGTGALTIEVAGVSGGNRGIAATNNGSGDMVVTATGRVTGGMGTGIIADNINGGALSITTMAEVTSDRFSGIVAFNAFGGTNLTISATDVSGADGGIDARNFGGGTLAITTTGSVTGGAGYGIYAQNANGGAIEVDAVGPVTGGTYGISAVNLAGSTGVTVNAGDVQGGVDAIRVDNYGTGDVQVTVGGVVSGDTGDGMHLRNRTGGDLSIVASQTVMSAEAVGIQAFNEAGTGAMTISVAGVSGGNGGIGAVNRGSGDLVLTATGQVTGGMRTAIIADNINGGALSITTTDEVSSDRYGGIVAFNAFSGTDLTISTAGISAAYGGIGAANFGSGNLSITTTGSVTGGTSYGIKAENAIGGAINVDAIGPVAGGTYGIVALNLADTSGLTVNAGDVQGGIDAIRVDNRGTGDMQVTVSGTVSGGTGAGINNIDTDAQGGTIEVLNTAALSSTAGVALRDGDGGTLLLSRGALAGDVLMGGGGDAVELFDGSATGKIGLGAGDDAIGIFGSGFGGGWDDSDFSGTFDNNLGQVLDLDGGDGIDTVALFGVTAAAQALGTGTDIEALALIGDTLLQANNADLTGFGALFIGDTSTLQADGNSPSDSTTGSLGNDGVIDLIDGETNDTLTVEGDFAGSAGSVLQLDFDADNGGASDSLIVTGDVADVAVGPFSVENERTGIVLNVFGDGRGSRTAGDGVRLVDVAGIAEADDFFLVDGEFDIGIFDYQLVFEDGAFLLRGDFFEQIYAYENLPGAMQTIGLALTGQLVERVGVRSGTASTLAGADGTPVTGGQPVDTALWARAVGLSLESDGDIDSTTGGSFEQTVGFIQGGGEVVVSEGASGRLLIGALGHWGTSSQDLTDNRGDDAGNTSFDFYGGGLTATWYGTGGLYVDGVVQYTAYDIDINPVSRFASVSTDGYGIAASGEVGYRIPIGATAALVPQAQLTYQHLDFDDFTDPDGVAVSLDDGDSLVGRLGVAFENSAAIGSALVTGYAEANVLHDFLGDNSVTATTGGERFALNQDLGGTSVELGFGGTVAVSRGVSLYAEVDYALPLDGGVRGVQALGGIRVNLNPPPPPPLPAPVIAPVAETAFIVFFDWDRADLTSEANLVLDEVAVVANETGYASIRLDGYTDLSGSAAYNLGLSERRANAVANGLIARGIAPDEIVIRAFGEENPLVPTPDGVREPQNRRVEIFLG